MRVLPIAFFILLLLSAGTRSEQPEKQAPANRNASQPTAVAPALKSNEEYLELYSLLAEAVATVELNYARPVDRRRLFETALDGMLRDLDPYSAYLTRDKLRELESRTAGKDLRPRHFGLEIAVRDDQLVVLSVLPDSAAHRGGIRPGDQLVSISDQPADQLSLSAAEALLESSAEQLFVVVVTPGTDENRPLKLTQTAPPVSTVAGKNRGGVADSYLARTEPRIAYVAIHSFAANSAADLTKALRIAGEDGLLDGLVLDLRFNAGGLLSAAVEVADMFLSEGQIVSTSGRNTETKSWKAEEDAPFGQIPLVVLINRYSASSAEIVAAALQDNGRATIVGERSWGKGSVQNVFQLAGGSGIKLTTASYHRPSGANIHRFAGDGPQQVWGVSPRAKWALAISAEEAQTLIDRRERIAKGEQNAAPVIDRQLDLAIEAVLEKLP